MFYPATSSGGNGEVWRGVWGFVMGRGGRMTPGGSRGEVYIRWVLSSRVYEWRVPCWVGRPCRDVSVGVWLRPVRDAHHSTVASTSRSRSLCASVSRQQLDVRLPSGAHVSQILGLRLKPKAGDGAGGHHRRYRTTTIYGPLSMTTRVSRHQNFQQH